MASIGGIFVGINKCAYHLRMVARRKKEPEKRPRGRPLKYGDDVHRIVFRIPNDLFDRIKALSDEAEVSIQDLLVVAFRAWLKSNDPKPTPARVKQWVASLTGNS